jgi:pimeloyl-ACP methyl ester carboxylesterase
MPDSPGGPITFVVPGFEVGTARGAGGVVPSAEQDLGPVRQFVKVSSRRAGGGEVRASAFPGQDAVVLELAGGPSLTLHPENARDLMLAQSGAGGVSRGAAEVASNEVQVPADLQWSGQEMAGAASRGLFGRVVLSGFKVVALNKAADFTAEQVAERVDGQVREGVYQLEPGELKNLKESASPLTEVPESAAPVLVLVHGTFSTTQGTFRKLWTDHPQRVLSLFESYGGHVYALDHSTLGASPIENALTLARALPRNVRVHLVTHSRGGLVAEVLARACGDPDASFELFEQKGYEAQREALQSLVALVNKDQKNIAVERVVRVACPARGTLLASKRLDAYVSILKWSLELAGLPVVPEILAFLGAVAKRRTDPELLPGLAAQVPNSPLIRWLHQTGRRIPGDLRVIAGDMKGDAIISWLKTLLSDAFFWTDNDLVVQTRSMYGGTPRETDTETGSEKGALFVLDQGGKVSHFNYFSNERTATAICDALIQKEPLGFRTIGPLSWAGESSDGLRAARQAAVRGGDRPAVILLPGILGSNLKVGDDRIWVSWRLVNGLRRLRYAGNNNVEPDGPIDSYYSALAGFLRQTHDVIELAYDWRRPIEEEARRLAGVVREALAARSASGLPVRILAHSMGGLVARTLQLDDSQLWEDMMKRPGARVVMLGTPNRGSWAPMQVLSGDDTFGNALAMIGTLFQDDESRELMGEFPGFLQLQAGLLDEARGLARRETWSEWAEKDLDLKLQLNSFRWGVPSQEALDRAVALRRRLDAQELAGFADRLALVVGRADFTPEDFEIGPEGLVYLNALGSGDGRVPLRNALLPAVRTWSLDCDHAGLPSRESAFPAYLDLLESGRTARLPEMPEKERQSILASVERPESRLEMVRSRASRQRFQVRPPERERELLALESRERAEEPGGEGSSLQVTVVNGDLAFIRQPLLLGHYRSLRLTGTEGLMDGLIGGTLKRSLGMGLYPEAPGAHQIFYNRRSDPENPMGVPRPRAVVVVGLGEEGKLKSDDLVLTVRQAVIAWAQRAAEEGDSSLQLDLAATLIGSGGSGITVSQSAQSIARGVQEANDILEGERQGGSGDRDGDRSSRRWPQVRHLYLIEIYLDRATEAWYALQMQAAAMPGRLQVTSSVQSGTGALRRPPDAGYRGASYDFVSARTEMGSTGEGRIEYSLDTRRARTEVRAHAPQSRLLQKLIREGANDQNTNPQIGRTLFRLLVPPEIEPFLASTTDMQIEVDSGTAGIPWELLDTTVRGSRDSRPWAIRTKLLRKLRKEGASAQLADASADDAVLVIGEPECDSQRYPRLPGARREARAVVSRLTGPGGLTADRVESFTSLEGEGSFGANASTIINALLSREWRIIHISGHGEPPEILPDGRFGDPRGVVLSDGTFLGPSEIGSLRTVPELVFVNCCYLAARETRELFRLSESRLSYDRARFAAGVAEKLIDLGVRCVVAAGWAVEDEPAREFATTFYDVLLKGGRFIEAVGKAREAAYEMGGNTWAAYQCYGDPDWRFQAQVVDPQVPSLAMADEYSSIASPAGLVLALETLAVKSRFRRERPELQTTRLRYLEASFGPQWEQLGEVAEAFGEAWSALERPEKALEWYDKAVAANDGGASLRAAEQRVNHRVRLAWSEVSRALDPKSRDRDPAAFEAVVRSSRDTIQEAVGLLKNLVALQPTMERESLLGSAYKRLAMIAAAAGGRGSEKREQEALEEM